jgi:predicted site-specific integrase-resolvase
LTDLTVAEVARLCGVSARVPRLWIQRGLLPARVLPRQWGRYRVSPAGLEAFLRAHPEQVQPARMPATRWRGLVEAGLQADPFWPVERVAAYVGRAGVTIRAWVRRGVLPAVWAPSAAGTGPGRWLVRRSAVFAWQRRAEEASA